MSMSSSFRRDVLRLASAALDGASRPTRTAAVQSVLDKIAEDAECRTECLKLLGTGGLATEASQRCASVHSYKRLAVVVQSAIVAEAATVEEGESGDINLRALCKALCHLLGASENVALLGDASAALRGCGKAELLYGQFVEVAKGCNEQCGEAKSSASCVTHPALSLAATIADSSVRDEAHLMELFLASFASNTFPSPEQLAMARAFLSTVSQSSFDEQLAPTLGLKLRAHPDKVLPLAEVIFSSLVAAGSKIDVSSQLSNGDGANLLPSVMKHLKSSKAKMRGHAWRTLVLLAQLGEGTNSVAPVNQALAEALGGGAGGGLTTSDLRAGGYAALEGIARCIIGKVNASESSFGEEDMAAMGKLADGALNALTTCLPKDKTSSAASADPALVAKEVGTAALLVWMQLAKRLKATGEKGGYDGALDYLAEPTAKYNPKEGEFRFRIGALIVPPPSSYLSAVAGIDGNGVIGGEPFLESVVVDLIEKKQVQKGMEAIVDAAVKKHSSSDAVAQIDGALAIFLLVLYRSALPSANFALPASAAKVIAAGGTVKGHETSYLFSPSLLETARTDTLTNYVLHRTIALHCKATSKAEGEGKTVKGDQPLVRVIEKRLEEGHASPYSAAARALAICAANPHHLSGPPSASYASVHASLKTVVTYSPVTAKTADAIFFAVFVHVNERSLKNEEDRIALNETRAARERFDPIDETFNKLPGGSSRGKLSGASSHRGYDPASIRRLSNDLLSSAGSADAMWRALVLSHAGTTMRSNRRQRVALISHVLDALTETVLSFAERSKNGSDGGEVVDALAKFIATCAASSQLSTAPKKDDDEKEESDPQDKSPEKSDGGIAISPSIHEAANSLVNTLGGIAGSFDAEFDDAEEEEKKAYAFTSGLCIQKLPSHLVSHLTNSLDNVESLSEEDVALYQSPKGILFRPGGSGQEGDKAPSSGAKLAAEKRKGKKKGGGFNAFEDEEWEKQVKKDLAKKKKAQESGAVATEKPLTPEEKGLLDKQTLRREQLSTTLKGDLPRSMAAIRCLCLSDIEVGNAALPVLGPIVVSAAVSNCVALTSLDALQKDAFETLSTLASCVYEIDEVHAPTLARALVVSYAGQQEKGDKEKEGKERELNVGPLSSPCAPAACAIFEMNDYGDTLSGNSFSFLFPVLRAALAGPRNIPGCDAALEVLERHCALFTTDDQDAKIVKPLRKEMALAVLELLSYDRCMSFVNPSPYEALIACYSTGEGGSGLTLSAPEIAPLIGEKGALGCENARVASMEALAAIAEGNPKLVKSNPLIENRMWLNCFDSKDRIKRAARKAWLVSRGHSADEHVDATPLDSPSRMYAVPLLPLLSHEDASIANAAATSFASAMGLIPETSEKNVLKLCNTFIASFPAPGGDEEETKSSMPTASASPFPVAPPPAAKKPAKKKVIDTGLPKKKKKASSVTTSMAKITGGPAPRKSAATKKLLAKTAPKKERTLDQSALMDQFKAPSTGKKKFAAEEDSESKVAVRLGVLRTISALTEPSANVPLDVPLLKILLGFLTAFGMGDGNEGVRNASSNASRDIVAHYGSSDEAIAFFLPQFESVLNTGRADYDLGSLDSEKVPKTVQASDYRKEGVVLSLGSVALHLKNDADEDKIDGIVDMLLAALKTPSEDVQSSVALCLSKLMKKGRTQQRIEVLLNDLMTECIHGSSLASRRGAAYGISAAVKGSGIASLKKYDVVKRLEEACTSGDANSKEGGLFCIELLSGRLGILFEPYVIVLLPALLKAFSDSNDYVRAAADKTVGLIMGNLSGHGVKLVMPAVLDAFDEPEWRTKVASIRMLGSMGHCAPKQLASCLPKVVPKLTEAFGDTHPKVKGSAEEALEEICKVIKNPEISSISAALLKALTDASATLHALEALISTEFVHAIDAPSLSIIIPVVHRGLRDRAATTKRYAALISGNICTMVNDPRDFVPYLPILLPDLKSTLLDPIPDVRSISAKSLGSLTRGLGEATFPDLRPWLIDTLRSEEGSSVERSGAAQGLSEVLVASGAQLTENVMINEILPLKSHPKAGTREGVLWVLTFLPSVLGQAYSSLIDESLPALLSGLADDNEAVRDVALRAGRVLVRSLGKAHKDKILPSLEDGLANEDYRIRVASLTLLGDLLGMLGGTKVGKANTDTQDDIRQAERAQAQIALALGNETRKRVLSSLYLARSDTAAVVRQSAVQVWKTVVSVTPRTLREILSQLVDQIVTALASGDPERTQVAGRCLGDIVQKLGDQVLPEIIPVLRDNLYRGDEYTRQGVCVGLAEVIDCSSKEQLQKFLDIIIKVVQDALCDDDQEVRTMAASCFQNLYNVVGNRTLDEIVPALLVAMESEDEEEKTRALNGMTGILSVRSRELLPYIIPKLLKSPFTISNADALGSISSATSETIHMHFSTIIPTLITELASFSDGDLDEEEKERKEAVRRCCRSVYHNVGPIGINWLVSEIASKCTHDKESVRKEACWSFQVVLEENAAMWKKAADFYEQIPVIIRELSHRLNDDSTAVLKANNKALAALTSCVPAEELVTHLQFLRNLIASMVSDARYRKGGVGDGEFFLPGFNMPKGLEPLLPIYQRGILYGNAHTREMAAAGLGELITITATKYLAGPFLIKLTGPLLRIVGDRNPSEVKIAIVQTLGLILTKGGPALRAFVPQFQTTFVKALSDPSRQVRVEAIKALALLMPLSTRVDPLIKELVATSLGKGSSATVETAGLVAIQTATLEALAVVLKHGGSKAKIAESIPSSLDAGKELVAHEDDGIRESAAKVISFACELLGADESNDVIQEYVLDRATNISSVSLETKHGIACICRRVCSRTVGREIDRSLYESVISVVQTLMKDEKTLVKEAACAAIGAVLGSSTDVNSTLSSVEKSILKCMTDKEELSVQQAVANGLCVTARLQPGLFRTQEGLPLINGALKLALSGAQRVQFSYNDFLWIALDVKNGEGGLEEYLAIAHFDSAKKMQQVHSKVLSRIKKINDDEF
ncbi:hypothetical protein ACHAXT_013025 [Thalassiosira profunda]